MPYAARTKVDSEATQGQIKKLIQRYGADQYGVLEDTTRAVIVFSAHTYRIQIVLPLPALDDKAFRRPGSTQQSRERRWEQERRRRWRALLLIIKAKLEAVASKVTTFEQEFLANIVVATKGGGAACLGDLLMPQVAEVYKTGRPLPALMAVPGVEQP